MYDVAKRVYILPLRNENYVPLKHTPSFYQFVYILPLRNENESLTRATYLFLIVYILPLRNENRNK